MFWKRKFKEHWKPGLCHCAGVLFAPAPGIWDCATQWPDWHCFSWSKRAPQKAARASREVRLLGPEGQNQILWKDTRQKTEVENAPRVCLCGGTPTKNLHLPSGLRKEFTISFHAGTYAVLCSPGPCFIGVQCGGDHQCVVLVRKLFLTTGDSRLDEVKVSSSDYGVSGTIALPPRCTVT